MRYLPAKTFSTPSLLNRYFPQHRLIISDFDALPEIDGFDISGANTVPGQMIPCSTYLVPWTL
jgi:hypothetical protein